MLNGDGNDFVASFDLEPTLLRNHKKVYRRNLSLENFSSSSPRLTPTEYKLVASRTKILQSTLIDVRPRRTIHVTNCCRRPNCRATHCGLSTLLPLAPDFRPVVERNPPLPPSSSAVSNRSSASSSLQTAIDSLDDLISQTFDRQEDMEGRSSGQWKTNFESTRLMFKTDGPVRIRLGGIPDYLDPFDSKLDGHSDTSSSNGDSGIDMRGRAPQPPKTPVLRSRSAHSVDSLMSSLTNGVEEAASLFDRRPSYDDYTKRSSTMTWRRKDTLAAANDAGMTLSSSMSDFWTSALSQPKNDFFNKSSINAAATKLTDSSSNRIKIFDERIDKIFKSVIDVVSSQPPVDSSRNKPKMKLRQAPPRPETSFAELDNIIRDMEATGKRLENGLGADGFRKPTALDVNKLLTSNVVDDRFRNGFDDGLSPERQKLSSSPDNADSLATASPHSHYHHHHHGRSKHSSTTTRELFQVNEKFPRSNIWRSLATGSVAERVQQFDISRNKSANSVANDEQQQQEPQAPKPTSAVLDSLRNALAEASGEPSTSPLIAQPKSASVTVVLPSTSASSASTSAVVTLQQNGIRKKSSPNSSKSAAKSTNVPKFYFPNGKPAPTHDYESTLQKVATVFETFPNKKAKLNEMGIVAKTVDLPQYLKKHLFVACGGSATKSAITFQDFSKFWKKFSSDYTDDATKLVKLLSKNNKNYLVADDFTSMIQDIVDGHAGLSFLRDAPEFHSRYVITVIARILYTVNRSWSGRITADELAKSNLIPTLKKLDEVDDINLITDYFSYEHFYVIYCKFWELDRDHDLLIDRNDLARHNDYAISSRMVDRIFSGAVTKGGAPKNGKMTYSEFVCFLMSEEDKKNPTSIEYWFRCMDIDGDGVLSLYELEYFYEEQAKKMELTGIEPMPFIDVVCQMLDIVKPREKGKITLSDLKRCKMTPLFFDTFFNLEKYLEHEQKEAGGVAARVDVNDGLTEWERYAAEEYDALVAEEQGAGETEIQCDDSDDDVVVQPLSKSTPETALKTAINVDNQSYL